MKTFLNNPVYDALCSNDAHFNLGTGAVKLFNEQVSPFAGFSHDYSKGFDDLYQQLPAERKIIYATPSLINEPDGWQLLHEINGLQFVFNAGTTTASGTDPQLVALHKEHVEEMMALAALTRPGPFGKRTIEFGNYYGVFENGRLAAMTGQRLHLTNYTEISAVCTHPNYLGKGFAAALINQQLTIILSDGKIPFLHVRADNTRAITLYERLGFKRQGAMNFYFLKRK